MRVETLSLADWSFLVALDLLSPTTLGTVTGATPAPWETSICTVEPYGTDVARRRRLAHDLARGHARVDAAVDRRLEVARLDQLDRLALVQTLDLRHERRSRRRPTRTDHDDDRARRHLRAGYR